MTFDVVSRSLEYLLNICQNYVKSSCDLHNLKIETSSFVNTYASCLCGKHLFS